MTDLTTDQWINALAALGQVTAAVLAAIALILSLSTARRQQRLTAHVAHEQARLLREQVTVQRDSDIIRWTRAGVDSLAEAGAMIAGHDLQSMTPAHTGRHRDLCTRLSALADQGRLFFPNHAPDSKGQEKPAAFRGHRQSILDQLVFAYEILCGVDKLADASERAAAVERLMDLRRTFISEAQIAIDPRRFLELRQMDEHRRERGKLPAKR